MPSGNVLAASLLHLADGLAGAESWSGGAENGCRRIEVVAGDELGALRRLDIEEGTQGHHLAFLVADIQILYVPGLQAIAVVRLDIDLKHLIEFVEQIDKRRAQISLQGIKHIRQRDLQGLGLGPIDVQIELGAADAEGSGKALKAGLRTCRLDEVVCGLLELSHTEASAVFNHHLETARLAQAPDRRRDHHKSLRFLNPQQAHG